MEIATNMLSSPPGGCHEDPDHNFYQVPWLRSLIILVLFSIIFITIFILFGSTVQSDYSKAARLAYLIPTPNFPTWLPVSSLLGTVSYILFSLLLKDMFTLKWTTLLIVINFAFISFYVIGPLFNEIIVSAGFVTGVLWYVELVFYHTRGAEAAK